MNNTYHCPLGDYDCPYYDEDGFCRLGEDAVEQCDDAAFFEGIFEEEDEEDFTFFESWENPDEIRYDELFRTLAEMPEDF